MNLRLQQALFENVRAFRNIKNGKIKYTLGSADKEADYEGVMIIPNLPNEVIDEVVAPEGMPKPYAWCIESNDSADWCFAKTKDGVEFNSTLMDSQCGITGAFPLYTSWPLDAVKRLQDALSNLLDEQNGPPLHKRKDEWEAAMMAGYEALKAAKDAGL